MLLHFGINAIAKSVMILKGTPFSHKCDVEILLEKLKIITLTTTLNYDQALPPKVKRVRLVALT